MNPLLILIAALSLGQVSEGSQPDPFQAARFREHVAYLASNELQGRLPGSEGSEKAAKYIVQHFEKSALAPLGEQGGFLQVFTRSNRSGTNLLAVFPGQGELAEEAILVCAHYDHLGTMPVPAREDGIFNGADDDASGVAATLLIAEALNTHRKELGPSHRAVVFAAFDCEEKGLLGAYHYVEHPRWPLKKTYAVMEFDGMGRPRGNQVFAADITCAPTLQKRIEALADPCGLRVETRLGGIGARSDYAVFLNAKIPAFLLFTGLNSDYHQVTDEVKNLDCEGAARIAWLSYRMLAETMSDPTPLEFQNAQPKFSVANALRLFSHFGVFPNLGTQTGRYPVIFAVTPGSAAAHCGLMAGDQVTAINGITLQRMEDALLVFPQLQLSNGLRLKVLRDEKEIEIFAPGKEFENLSGPRGKPLGEDQYEVIFNYRPRGSAKELFLAGTFNDWKPTALKMDGPDANGCFSARLVLKKGVYEYKFVRDGKDWEADPDNIYQTDAYQNNLLFVGVEP